MKNINKYFFVILLAVVLVSPSAPRVQAQSTDPAESEQLASILSALDQTVQRLKAQVQSLIKTSVPSVRAATIYSFSASPTYINSGDSVTLSWSTDASSGSLLYNCISGVSVRGYSCGYAYPMGGASIDLVIDNTSGVDQTVTFTAQVNGDTKYAGVTILGAFSPETIIDNTSSQTKKSGAWCTSSVLNFYGTDSIYSCGSGSDSFQWIPSFSGSAEYEVFMWWTAHPNRSTNVPVKILANVRGVQIPSTVYVNQQVNGGKWNSLGTFPLSAGSYVEISDQNGQAIADAVKFVKVGSPAQEQSFTASADKTVGSAPLSVTFAVTLNNFPLCGNAFTWNFGDDTESSVEACPTSGVVAIVPSRTFQKTHTYMKEGTYTVTLTVNKLLPKNVATIQVFQVALPSLELQLIPVIVNAITPDSGDLTKTFPVGQMFSVAGLMLDLSPSNNVSVNSVTVEVWLSSNKIASIPLLCEKAGTAILCSDEVWSATSVPVGRNTYTFKLAGNDILGRSFSETDNISLDFRQVDSSACKELLPNHNISTADRANIVFVGAGYENISGISQEQAVQLIATAVVDPLSKNYGLLSVEPFKSNAHKFNFWYVNKFISRSECNNVDGRCSLSVIAPLFESCPYGNKYIVNLIDAGGLVGMETAAGERYVSLGAVVWPSSSFEIGMQSVTFVHEFGHTFGRLADEYVLYPDQTKSEETPTSMFAGSKNVYAGPQHTQSECVLNAPWRDLIGNGCGEDGVLDCQPADPLYNLEVSCFEGADKVGKGVFRSTRDSIML